MKKFTYLALMAAFCLSCSSDVTDTDTVGEGEIISSSGLSAINNLFGGSEEGSGDLNAALKSQEGEAGQSNCDEADNSIAPILIIQDGVFGDDNTSLAGTHGVEEETVTLDDFCANGGEWSGYAVGQAAGVDPIEFDCGLFMVGGQGIWKITGNFDSGDSNPEDFATIVNGTFVMAETADGTGTTFICSGNVGGESDTGLSCTDEAGAAADLGATESCLPTE